MARRSKAAAATPVPAEAPSSRPKPKARPRRPKARASAPPPAGGWRAWHTPSEATKFRWAAALVVGLLLSLACWSGEIQKLPDGGARVAFRNLKGQVTLGVEWHRGQWPHLSH